MRGSLKNLHIGMYGAVMGLAGLGLSARAAATLFPGTLRAPAYFTELWVALGFVALLVLLVLYFLKTVFHWESVKEDFTDPALLGFCGALPTGMTLVAGGIGPYAPALADALWWAGCALLACFMVWALVRWLQGGIELAKLNAGWLIILVGGIVVPGPGIALGHAEASRYLFGASVCACALILPVLFYRAGSAAPLPEALRPTWFILLVPPSLIYANGMALFAVESLEILYFFATLLAVALFIGARNLLRWPFGPAWWAFTFPLDAFAYAAARYAQAHPSMLWRSVAAIAILLATLFVAGVLARTLLSPSAILRSAASRAA
jgi:tellurite resistance protein